MYRRYFPINRLGEGQVVEEISRNCNVSGACADEIACIKLVELQQCAGKVGKFCSYLGQEPRITFVFTISSTTAASNPTTLRY